LWSIVLPILAQGNVGFECTFRRMTGPTRRSAKGGWTEEEVCSYILFYALQLLIALWDESIEIRCVALSSK